MRGKLAHEGTDIQYLFKLCQPSGVFLFFPQMFLAISSSQDGNVRSG